MAYALNDILQIKVNSTYVNQRGMNVFFYKVTEPQVDFYPNTVVMAFLTNVLTTTLPLLVPGIVYTSIEVRDLTNGIDVYEYPISTLGTSAGEGLPPYTCLAFRLNRSTAVTRHGQKRFWGLSESHQSAGILIPASQALTNIVASALEGELLEDSQNDRNFAAVPVIVGRTLDTEGKYQLDLAKINPILSAQFVSVSTQNTRKIGRGT